MTRKSQHILVFSLVAFLLTGCFRVRTRCGTLLYEAKTPVAVEALASRIEPLRTALRGDARFIEVTNHGTLAFTGAANSEFAECWVSYNRDEKDAASDQYVSLVVDTTSTWGAAKQVRNLRRVINEPIGTNVLQKLTVRFDSNWMDVR